MMRDCRKWKDIGLFFSTTLLLLLAIKDAEGIYCYNCYIFEGPQLPSLLFDLVTPPTGPHHLQPCPHPTDELGWSLREIREPPCLSPDSKCTLTHFEVNKTRGTLLGCSSPALITQMMAIETGSCFEALNSSVSVSICPQNLCQSDFCIPPHHALVQNDPLFPFPGLLLIFLAFLVIVGTILLILCLISFIKRSRKISHVINSSNTVLQDL